MMVSSERICGSRTLISENLENWGCVGNTEYVHAMFTKVHLH